MGKEYGRGTVEQWTFSEYCMSLSAGTGKGLLPPAHWHYVTRPRLMGQYGPVSVQHSTFTQRERYCRPSTTPPSRSSSSAHAESDVLHTDSPTQQSFLLALSIHRTRPVDAHSFVVTSDRRSRRRHSPDPFPMSSHHRANDSDYEPNFYIQEQ